MSVSLKTAMEGLYSYQNPRAYGNVVAKTADHTVTIAEITNGTTFLVTTASADVTFTLPDPSGLPDDDTIYTLNIHHVGGAYDMIVCNPADFVYGNENFNFGDAIGATIIAGHNTGIAASYGLMRSHTVKAGIHREAYLDAADFATTFATLALDSSHHNNNPEMIKWEELQSENFSATADNGDGTVTLTIAGHGFDAGDHLVIYAGELAGVYKALSVTTDTVVITSAAWTATYADDVAREDAIWFIAAGSYKFAYSISITPQSTSGGEWTCDAQIVKGNISDGIAVELDNCSHSVGAGSKNPGTIPAIGVYVDVVADDFIKLQVRNTDLATGATTGIDHAILHIERRLG